MWEGLLHANIWFWGNLFNKNLQIKEQTALLNKMELREKERQMTEFQQESLRRYVNLADAMPHMIVKIQADGKPEYFNRQWYDYTGAHNKVDVNWKSIVYPIPNIFTTSSIDVRPCPIFSMASSFKLFIPALRASCSISEGVAFATIFF